MRVVGKFRGRNLYGDLPARSQRAQRRLGHQGRPVRGVGHGQEAEGSRAWTLDAGLKRDTGQVDRGGRPARDRRRRHLHPRARGQPSDHGRPRATAEAQPPPPPPERPKVPPVVVFALPLDGESRGGPATAASSCSSARTWTRRRSPGACCCATRARSCRATAPSTRLKLTYDERPPRAHRGSRRRAAARPPDRAAPPARHRRHRRPDPRPAPRSRAGFGAVEAVDILRYLVASS